MHDLRCSVSFQDDIVAPTTNDLVIFILIPSANLQMQTDFVPKIMHHNLCN